MSLLSSIGNFLNPDDANAVSAAGSAVSNTVAPGSAYFQSGDLGLSSPGSTGNALVNSAAGLGAQNVGANFTPMDQDTDALHALGTSFYNQYLHGGKAEAAAKARAVSSMADAGGGGQGGISALTGASQQLSQQALGTSLQERGMMGSLANSDNLAAGMNALKKATFQTALTHANYQKNLAAQQAMFNLQTDQTGLNQQLQSGANQANYALQSGQIGTDLSQSQLGLGLTGAAASGVAAAGALGAGMSTTDPVAGSTVSESEIQNEAANTYAQLGMQPTALPAASAVQTGQEAAQVTQDQLNAALYGSSKIVYPTLQSDAAQYLVNPSAYPVNTKVT